MKKELIVHFTFLVAFFLLISLYKSYGANSLMDGWFDLEHIPFWIGGVIGLFLVYTDHLVYAYFLKPQEASSKKAVGLIEDKKIGEAAEVLVDSHEGSNDLIFHSARFQLLFLVFAFFIVTSTGSMLGRGIVLAFLLHLLMDMVRDMTEGQNLAKWFKGFLLPLDTRQRKWYVGIQIFLLLCMGLFI